MTTLILVQPTEIKEYISGISKPSIYVYETALLTTVMFGTDSKLSIRVFLTDVGKANLPIKPVTNVYVTIPKAVIKVLVLLVTVSNA